MAHSIDAPILVVEDSADVRRSLEWFLRLDGYRVVTAINGADALEKLHAGLRPCIILLDLVMPQMDGFEFRQRQRTDPSLADIPVVVYSGVGDPKSAAKQLDAMAYLRKPLDLDSLLATIETHCNKDAKAASPKLKRAS